MIKFKKSLCCELLACAKIGALKIDTNKTKPRNIPLFFIIITYKLCSSDLNKVFGLLFHDDFIRKDITEVMCRAKMARI
ncbi:MAG: hypothetical protein DRO96_03145 [Candidatus Aenigmatarchaeota archaeon]|nr:MAG: hypothetical protein DRO96_03145 [Candidatus Aenigmarchaeota archaeon]